MAEAMPSDQVQNDPNEEDEEEEDDDSERCPVYSGPDLFEFITSRVPDVQVPVEEFAFEYVRPMSANVNLLENPHGSVRLSQGSTSVITAVYGPSDIRMSKELPHRAAVDVLFRPKVTGSGNVNAMLALGFMDPITSERALEQIVVSVLESVIHLNDHLQAGFNVIIHEVEDNGSLLSTILNAVSLSLAIAGCSQRCVFASVCLAVSGDRVIIDPSSEQIESLKKSSTDSSPLSISTFVITNETPRRILTTRTTGQITPSNLNKLTRMLSTSSITDEIFNFMYKSLSVY